MCDAPGNRQKLTEEEVIELFVEYLADQGFSGLKVDSRPDKEKHQEKLTSSKIDIIAGQFAIEHTSIDSIPNQRGNDVLSEQVLKPLEDEFRCKLPFRLVLTVPYEGIQAGQNWRERSPKMTAALRQWVLNEAFKLPIGRHLINTVPDVPFEFRVNKSSSNRTGLLFNRPAPNDDTFSNRLRDQLDRKIKKLSHHKLKNKTTILLIESSDPSLMNDAIMRDGLRSAYPNGLPNGLDKIWFADTSLPKKTLFIEMTQSVSREESGYDGI